jgi:DNA-binding transcriptional ArsR family regulator
MSVDDRAKVFASLADPTRLRMVELLTQEEELCGTQIAKRLGISMSLLSHHWRILSDCGIVMRERRGQRQYCTVDRAALEDAFMLLWPNRRMRSMIPS